MGALRRTSQRKAYTPIPHTSQPILYQRRNAAYSRSVSDHHQHPEEERRASIVRVRKIVGQLGAVERMLEQDRDCTEILTQIVSARRGLKSLAEKLIHSHVHHCIEGAHSPAESRKKLAELLTVLERYVE